MADKLVANRNDQGVIERYVDQGDGTWARRGTSATMLGTAGTDRSVVATTTSQVLMAANPARRGYFIKNDSAVDVWVSFNGAAAAVAGAGNVRIAAGGYLENPATVSPTGQITIIAASGTPAVTAREF